jgi:DNA-binding MarR family transcriptional regulator
MSGSVRDAQYRALAEFRYRILRFLRSRDAAARAAGLEPQQYQRLLVTRGLPPGQGATIRTLVQWPLLQQHSAVELIDRLETHGYAAHSRSPVDRCSVLVSLLPRGERALEQVPQQRLEELRMTGSALVGAFGALLEGGQRGQRAQKRAWCSTAGKKRRLRSS